jgi:ATP-dependent DNA helicase RecG
VYYRPDRLVETVRHEAFTREGSSKRKLTELEKREIRIKKQEIDYEREDVPLKWPEDFDQDLVSEYVSNYARAKALSRPQQPEEILADTRLGRRVTDSSQRRCTLLFARDPRVVFPGAYVRLMKFAGKQERAGQKYNLIDGRTSDRGPLLD